jgi:hypothetical protein
MGNSDEAGAARMLKDLFAGAAGGVAQVLIGTAPPLPGRSQADIAGMRVYIGQPFGKLPPRFSALDDICIGRVSNPSFFMPRGWRGDCLRVPQTSSRSDCKPHPYMPTRWTPARRSTRTRVLWLSTRCGIERKTRKKKTFHKKKPPLHRPA